MGRINGANFVAEHMWRIYQIPKLYLSIVFGWKEKVRLDYNTIQFKHKIEGDDITFTVSKPFFLTRNDLWILIDLSYRVPCGLLENLYSAQKEGDCRNDLLSYGHRLRENFEIVSPKWTTKLVCVEDTLQKDLLLWQTRFCYVAKYVVRMDNFYTIFGSDWYFGVAWYLRQWIWKLKELFFFKLIDAINFHQDWTYSEGLKRLVKVEACENNLTILVLKKLVELGAC